MSRAVLLAGGRSARMGSPKAHLDAGGAPLWRVVADRLAAQGLEVVVAVGPEPWDTTPYPSVTDEGRGPLDGIAAADGGDLIVWTVDVPDVDDVALLEEPTAGIRCLRDDSGRAQPLLGVWSAAAVGDIPAHLDGGGRSVLGFLDHHPVELVGPARDRTHLTTPRDVERWLGSV